MHPTKVYTFSISAKPLHFDCTLNAGHAIGDLPQAGQIKSFCVFPVCFTRAGQNLGEVCEELS